MFSPRRAQSALLSVLIAGAFIAPPMHAETLDRIEVTITGLPDSMSPLVVTYNYEGGSVEDRFERDGEYSRASHQGLGGLNSITVLGETVPSGIRIIFYGPDGKAICARELRSGGTSKITIEITDEPLQ